ncbi:MAG: hypothetical protein LC104_01105, partial [Bacteroidales bacterium]|nr:hypothetical protein [Bacteroidales bacterium]
MSATNIADPYNRELMELMYQQWQHDPRSVDPTWQAFFAGVEFAGNGVASRPPSPASGAAELRLQTGAV